MKQAAAASNRALSQMTNAYNSQPSPVQQAVNGLQGPAVDAGYSFLRNRGFSRGGSFVSYVAALTIPQANYLADWSKATIQNAFIRSFAAGCP